MATQEQSSPSARAPNRTAKSHPQSNKRRARKVKAAAINGLMVPEGVERAIEAERGNLSKAESLLACLAIAVEHGSGEHKDEVSPPYYPDLARMARNLVRQSINALDSLHLEQQPARRKIREQSEIYGTHTWPFMRLGRDSMLLCHQQAV